MSYGVFADYYDALTRNVAYEKRADYLCRLCKDLGHEPGEALDLACGTGSLTLALAERGWDIYGVDASPEMLSAAQQKAAQAGKSLLFLCQRMESLDLYGTVNTVVCALDSINHLTELAQVQAAFDRVSLFLEPGGYFLFDVNTVYKHRKVLAEQVFVYDTDEVYCVWQNRYDPAQGREMVEISLDFFERRGAAYVRSSERFWERAYSVEEIRACLERAGMTLLHCYGDGTMEPPAEDCQRLMLVARKNVSEKGACL